MKKSLYRSRSDRKVTGLCGGLADYFNIDATLLRLVVVITAVFSGGTVILLYIVGAIIIPLEFQSTLGKVSDESWAWSSNVLSSSGVAPDPRVDEMMKDLEDKALRKENELLKRRLASYERGEMENGRI